MLLTVPSLWMDTKYWVFRYYILPDELIYDLLHVFCLVSLLDVEIVLGLLIEIF
jgi:hypothetical protein